MLTSTRNGQCAIRNASAPRPNAWTLLERAWHNLQRRRRHRATEKLLLGLSDRTLKDIGIHRSEIPSLMRDGDPLADRDRWRRMSRYY